MKRMIFICTTICIICIFALKFELGELKNFKDEMVDRYTVTSQVEDDDVQQAEMALQADDDVRQVERQINDEKVNEDLIKVSENFRYIGIAFVTMFVAIIVLKKPIELIHKKVFGDESPSFFEDVFNDDFSDD